MLSENRPERREYWERCALVVMEIAATRGNVDVVASIAAKSADAMLVEWDKRFQKPTEGSV